MTLPQLRVLVMIASHGPQNLGLGRGRARGLPSNATRLCERLVVAGLGARGDDPQDRRFLRLVLTGAGHDLVERVMQHRRGGHRAGHGPDVAIAAANRGVSAG